MNLDYMDSHDVLKKLSADLNRELKDAQRFFAAIEADERRWVEQGVDVDAAFAAKYYDSLDGTVDAAKTQLTSERLDVRGDPVKTAIFRGLLILGGLVAGFITLVACCIVAYRRYRAKPSNTAP
ncbi:MAG: hypothetical protein HY290_12400 [Planctomycetia bacterium]|nr:hypothetical protein [Planctomycetia bacterium]